jgi:hypothetical protein
MSSRTINQRTNELASDRVEETTGPATTWETAEFIFGEESLGLSGSPFVEPLEPVAAIAVGT